MRLDPQMEMIKQFGYPFDETMQLCETSLGGTELNFSPELEGFQSGSFNTKHAVILGIKCGICTALVFDRRGADKLSPDDEDEFKTSLKQKLSPGEISITKRERSNEGEYIAHACAKMGNFIAVFVLSGNLAIEFRDALRK